MDQGIPPAKKAKVENGHAVRSFVFHFVFICIQSIKTALLSFGPVILMLLKTILAYIHCALLFKFRTADVFTKIFMQFKHVLVPLTLSQQ